LNGADSAEVKGSRLEVLNRLGRNGSNRSGGCRRSCRRSGCSSPTSPSRRQRRRMSGRASTSRSARPSRAPYRTSRWVGTPARTDQHGPARSWPHPSPRPGHVPSVRVTSRAQATTRHASSRLPFDHYPSRPLHARGAPAPRPGIRRPGRHAHVPSAPAGLACGRPGLGRGGWGLGAGRGDAEAARRGARGSSASCGASSPWGRRHVRRTLRAHASALSGSQTGGLPEDHAGSTPSGSADDARGQAQEWR
jgi:hypothetical protein